MTKTQRKKQRTAPAILYIALGPPGSGEYMTDWLRSDLQSEIDRARKYGETYGEIHTYVLQEKSDG